MRALGIAILQFDALLTEIGCPAFSQLSSWFVFDFVCKLFAGLSALTGKAVSFRPAILAVSASVIYIYIVSFAAFFIGIMIYGFWTWEGMTGGREHVQMA